MEIKNPSRRDFVRNSLCTLALTALPGQIAFGQTAIRNRLEWNDFKNTADYPSLLDAFDKMERNATSTNRASYFYWNRVHVNYCPHGIAYFLAWHRGYLYYFEQQLRAVSGNSSLTLPYWDYYKNPTIPVEFLDSDINNPLYVDRVNNNVFEALSLAPFSDQVTNFQRGTANAFETSLENQPHNLVHDIIGGFMATLRSPLDPIFWMHHANIDRLWSAWVAAANGRRMPSQTSTYWSGRFTYNTDLTLLRNRTYDTTTFLGYRYQDNTLPVALPAQAQSARIIRVSTQGMSSQAAPSRPPLGNFKMSGPRARGKYRRSIGGAKGIALDEKSISVQIPLERLDKQSLRSIHESTRLTPFGKTKPAAGQYTSVQVVLDNLRLTSAGENGGFFYRVYLNLPEHGDASSPKEKYLLGTVGPFQIASALHHGSSARLTFPATQLLKTLTPDQITELIVSFVRVSGKNSPKGQTIVADEVRIELSNDEIE